MERFKKSEKPILLADAFPRLKLSIENDEIDLAMLAIEEHQKALIQKKKLEAVKQPIQESLSGAGAVFFRRAK